MKENQIIMSNVSVKELSAQILGDFFKEVAEVRKMVDALEYKHQWIKPREAGEIIGHSESFVRKLVREGELSAYYPGSDLVLNKGEVIAFMESRKVKHS